MGEHNLLRPFAPPECRRKVATLTLHGALIEIFRNSKCQHSAIGGHTNTALQL